MTVSVTILDTPIRIRLTGDAALAVRAANEMAVAVVAVTPAIGVPGEPGTPGAVGSTGATGAPGATGPAGETGPAGIAAAYLHTQAVAAATWIVNHNRGAIPAAVTVLTVGSVEMDCEVAHTTPNQVLLLFVLPTAGTARLL
jgi:hypothetical protein